MTVSYQFVKFDDPFDSHSSLLSPLRGPTLPMSQQKQSVKSSDQSAPMMADVNPAQEKFPCTDEALLWESGQEDPTTR